RSGTLNWGAIAHKGTSTKARLSNLGCGTSRRSVSTFSVPYNKISKSIVRGPLSIVRSLFNTCSICRSEEHTSELQSRFDLVCRLLLEKKIQSCNSPLRNI